MSAEESLDRGEGPGSVERWRTALRDGRIEGQRCTDCDHHVATPKAACPDCGSRAIEPTTLPTTGEVHSVTDIAVPPAEFEGPYTVGIVDLGPARIMGRIEGDVRIGDSVALSGVLEETSVAPLFAPE